MTQIKVGVVRKVLGLAMFWSLTAFSPLCFGQVPFSLVPTPNPPVIVESIMNKDRVIHSGDRLGANNGDVSWLNGLSINLRNSSGKEIISLTIVLMFAHDKQGVPLLVSPVARGFEDPVSVVAAKAPESAVKIAPAEVYTIHYSSEEYASLLSFLKSRLGDDLENLAVKMLVERVIFDDDTAYITGKVMRRDPERRNRWIADQYFDRIRKKVSGLMRQPEFSRPPLKKVEFEHARLTCCSNSLSFFNESAAFFGAEIRPDQIGPDSELVLD